MKTKFNSGQDPPDTTTLQLKATPPSEKDPPDTTASQLKAAVPSAVIVSPGRITRCCDCAETRFWQATAPSREEQSHKTVSQLKMVRLIRQLECIGLALKKTNVPNQLNRKQFLERLDQSGFRGLYDFVYVPMDRSTRMNVGYAFVNFIKPEFFRMCQAVLQGKSFLEKEDRNKRRSGKPIVVSPAHVQGLQNNEKHFKDAAVSHTLHRPVKFVCNGNSGLGLAKVRLANQEDMQPMHLSGEAHIFHSVEIIDHLQETFPSIADGMTEDLKLQWLTPASERQSAFEALGKEDLGPALAYSPLFQVIDGDDGWPQESVQRLLRLHRSHSKAWPWISTQLHKVLGPRDPDLDRLVLVIFGDLTRKEATVDMVDGMTREANGTTGIRKFAAHVTPVMLVEGVGIEAIDLGCFCVSTAEKEGVLRHLHDEEVKIGGLAGLKGAAEGGRMCGVRPPGMLTGEDTQSSVVGQTLAGGTVMSGPGAATTADRLRMWMPDARIGVAMCAAGTLMHRSCLGDEEVKVSFAAPFLRSVGGICVQEVPGAQQAALIVQPQRSWRKFSTCQQLLQIAAPRKGEWCKGQACLASGGTYNDVAGIWKDVKGAYPIKAAPKPSMRPLLDDAVKEWDGVQSDVQGDVSCPVLLCPHLEAKKMLATPGNGRLCCRVKRVSPVPMACDVRSVLLERLVVWCLDSATCWLGGTCKPVTWGWLSGAVVMPYEEDGESWDLNYSQHVDGMAENRPGHKKFDAYRLPKWVKHPLSHPFSGITIGPDAYAYACLNGTLDGLTNFLGWGPAHIACMYGNMEMLQACTEQELSAQTFNGETPAWYAVRYGTSWCLQWLVEHGADTTTPDLNGYTPQQLIHVNNRNDGQEMEWLEAAIKGELTEKKNQQAQEFKLKKWRFEGLDSYAEDWLDKNKAKQRKHLYKTGDFPDPYPLPTAEELWAKMDLPRSTIPRPPAKSKPPLPVAMLFPGQGSQYVGMLKSCLDIPAVEKMLEKAESILGWSVKKFCLEGPAEQIEQTKYCQPIMFVAGVAGIELMKQTKREMVDRVQAVAGLSLGEYTALCAAGVLEFEDGLQLVKLRAEAMQKATEMVPQAMCSVAGLDRNTVDRLCKEAKDLDTSSPMPVCQVANVLFPAGFTCGGTKPAIEKLCELAMKARALQARAVKTGGGFHTPLMQPAQEELSKAIDSMLPKMKPPRCAVYFNLTGKKMPPGTKPSEFVDYMKKQLTGEVLWEQTVKQMVFDGVKDFYEVGPLKQLKAMIKRIDQDAFKRTENIPV
ncbi:Malonyl-CoA-acyl carrier protein transacylase, mitochondrial [Symbiodinium microadriaticum]|uniref:Malonyl-CoA-acyl carrier protein transacylase, mitochondrial n=1 Tax=Symbiodinium microadriaticum TaxID=2951 RepID=A0A1Q9D082_SYMMI|nr:Malonyl-CoA-acyl carrier protein transacylase, mitochondrial [Symbiodinium microadriaticum]